MEIIKIQNVPSQNTWKTEKNIGNEFFYKLMKIPFYILEDTAGPSGVNIPFSRVNY